MLGVSIFTLTNFCIHWITNVKCFVLTSGVAISILLLLLIFLVTLLFLLLLLWTLLLVGSCCLNLLSLLSFVYGFV